MMTTNSVLGPFMLGRHHAAAARRFQAWGHPIGDLSEGKSLTPREVRTSTLGCVSRLKCDVYWMMLHTPTQCDVRLIAARTTFGL